ncbi:AKR7A2 [Symbiodinium sp. CCMP2456]|nr:AKR7A2 [Symbiodinium sp. CCMP2456]
MMRIRLCAMEACRRACAARGASRGAAGITGGRLVVESLVAADVRKVFGIPATHLASIYRVLEGRKDIQHVTMRHEQACGFAADGHARATGDLAVAMATTGVGFTNVVTPMAVALADSVPMLVVTTEVPRFWAERPGRQFSHFVPHVSKIAASVAKECFEIGSVDEIETAVSSAASLARSGRPGPVHINIPVDILNSVTGGKDTSATTQQFPSEASLDQRAQATLKSFASDLALCERPLILAGGGSVHASSQLLEFATALGAPVLTTVAGKGCIDERHGLAVGARLHLPAARDYLLDRADALIFLGTQISPTDFWHYTYAVDVPLGLERFGSRALHMDLDRASLDQGGVGAAGRVVQADVAAACKFLEGQLERQRDSWKGQPEEAAAHAKQLSDDSETMTKALSLDFLQATPMSPGRLMCRTLDKLRCKLPLKVPLFADVCRLGYTALSFYPAYRPRSFLYPVGTTCLGYALPAAIGAAIAERGLPVAVLVGDGGLQFNIQELAVAAEEHLPILTILWNDSGYGEIRSVSGEFGTSWASPNFAQICAGYGIKHVLVTDMTSLDEAFESSEVTAVLRGDGGPVLLEVACPPEAKATVQGRVSSRREVPKFILGTMTLGWDKASSFVDEAVAAQMINYFLAEGHHEIDTARMYSEGRAEQMLAGCVAQLPHDLRRKVLLATKANPAAEAGDFAIMGGFQDPMLSSQFTRSLDALSTDNVDLFYLHWPDSTASMEETLQQVQRAYVEGKFTRFGISNYWPSEVSRIHQHMKDRNWILPTVYQGMYNALTRNVEKELFPLLRDLGMSFYAFNPLAGGLLTGKHSLEKPASRGRFHQNDDYQKRYWKQEYFEAMKIVTAQTEAAGIPMSEAALRWLIHHSMLRGEFGDGLIIGCSSLSQLKENLSVSGSEPLPARVATAWEDAWECVKPVCPPFSPQMR